MSGDPILPRAATAVLAAALAMDAHALWDDRLEIFVAETFTHDDNVFRLSDEQDPVSAIGSPSTSDSYWTTAFGLKFDVPASAQRFVGHVTWSRHRFGRFPVLDLDAHEGQVEWRWQIGNSLDGEIGYGEQLTMASPANVQDGFQSTSPNFIDTQRSFFNVNYGFAARWQLRAGLSRREQSNSAPEFRLSDLSADTGELALALFTRASSQLGVRARVTEGTLPNEQPVDGVSVDNSFRQRSVAAFVEWPVTPQSSIGVSVGPVSRTYVELPERDFDTVAYRAAFEWRPTARLSLGAAADRDISADEEVNLGFVLVERLGLHSQFRQSEKVEWSMYLGYGDRTYLGQPAQALSPLPPREESVFFGSLRLSYRPSPILSLDLSVRRQSRSSPAASGDYEASMISAGVRAAF